MKHNKTCTAMYIWEKNCKLPKDRRLLTKSIRILITLVEMQQSTGSLLSRQ